MFPPEARRLQLSTRRSGMTRKRPSSSEKGQTTETSKNDTSDIERYRESEDEKPPPWVTSTFPSTSYPQLEIITTAIPTDSERSRKHAPSTIEYRVYNLKKSCWPVNRPIVRGDGWGWWDGFVVLALGLFWWAYGLEGSFLIMKSGLSDGDSSDQVSGSLHDIE
jgi:hypothetical protein